MRRPFRDRTITWVLLGLVVGPFAATTTGCLHESTPPAQLRGELSREKSVYFVQECTTRRRYELQMRAQSRVALDRRVEQIRQTSDGPILVELGGRSLPATTTTDGDALFEVRAQYAVRAGACK